MHAASSYVERTNISHVKFQVRSHDGFKHEVEVVRDGASWTETSWRSNHQSSVPWGLAVCEGCSNAKPLTRMTCMRWAIHAFHNLLHAATSMSSSPRSRSTEAQKFNFDIQGRSTLKFNHTITLPAQSFDLAFSAALLIFNASLTPKSIRTSSDPPGTTKDGTAR